MRRIFFSLLLLLGCLSAAADVVTGRIVDAQTGEALPDAEVTILNIHENATGFYQLHCDSTGRFACNVAGYNCRLEASCVGYHPRKVGFAAMEGTDTLDLGDIALKPSEVLLRTAVATAKARRFVMRGDTVVFNPAAFNLSEGGASRRTHQAVAGRDAEGRETLLDGQTRAHPRERRRNVCRQHAAAGASAR